MLKKSTSALSLTIITWLLWTIFIPKTVGNFTESLTPLSTRIELSEKMQDDRSKGIDGHNPFDDRKIEFIYHSSDSMGGFDEVAFDHMSL